MRDQLEAFFTDEVLAHGGYLLGGGGACLQFQPVDFSTTEAGDLSPARACVRLGMGYLYLRDARPWGVHIPDVGTYPTLREARHRRRGVPPGTLRGGGSRSRRARVLALNGPGRPSPTRQPPSVAPAPVYAATGPWGDHRSIACRCVVRRATFDLPMAEPTHTRELWDLLIAAFRQTPGNYAEAGRVASCGWRAAKRAWLLGWPEMPWGAVSIRDMLLAEAQAARDADAAAVQTRKDLEALGRESRKRAAVDAWRLEGQIVSAMSENILLAAKVQRSLLKVAEQMRDQLADLAGDGKLKDLSPREQLAAVIGIVRGMDSITRAVSAVSDWNKKHHEQPPLAVEEQGATKGATPQEVAKDLLELKEQLDRAASYGALTLLEGGGAK